MVETVRFIRGDEFHKAKSPGIIIYNLCTVLHVKDDMVMFGIGFMVMGEIGQSIIAFDDKTPTHAQMHKKPVAR